MIRSIIQIALITTVSLFISCTTKESTSVLDMYKTYEKDTSLTIPEMIPVYVGPLYITGGAFDRYYTAKCNPTKLGEIKANSLLINGDLSGTFDTFSFKTIEYFKVTAKTSMDTFYVMHMNSVMKGKKFEIVVELREGPHYDRTIFLFEEGKRYMMLFWKDSINIAEPDKSKEI